MGNLPRAPFHIALLDSGVRTDLLVVDKGKDQERREIGWARQIGQRRSFCPQGAEAGWCRGVNLRYGEFGGNAANLANERAS